MMRTGRKHINGDRLAILAMSVLFLLPIAVLLQREMSVRLSEQTLLEGTYLKSENGMIIRLTEDSEQDNLWYFFLPSGYDITQARVFFDGAVTLRMGDKEYRSGDVMSDLALKKRINMVYTKRDAVYAAGELVVCQSEKVPSVMINMTGTGTLDQIREDISKKTERRAAYVTFTPDMERAQNGTCVIGGRGNVSWKASDLKKSYKLTLDAKDAILGMQPASRWTLLAGYYDPSFLRNRIAMDAARTMGYEDTPDDLFVNLYVDGVYQGLYQMTQKVDMDGGCIPRTAGNNVLLEFNTQGWENADDISFQSALKLVSVIYPRRMSEESVQTLADEISAGEAVLMRHNDTYTSFIDKESFIRQFLLQEVLLNKDVDFSSTFIYRKGDDVVWKAGPVWDFDRSMGAWEYKLSYNGTETRVMWIAGMTRDGNVLSGWYKELADNEIFMEEVKSYYEIVFSDIVQEMTASKLPAWKEEILTAVEMDHLLQHQSMDIFYEEYDAICRWLDERRQFLDALWIAEDTHIRITFYTRHDEDNAHDMMVYVRPGDTLNAFPSGNRIVGWQDADGRNVLPGNPFTENVTLYPVYED